MPKTIDPSRPEPFGSYAAGSFYRSASAFSGVFMGCVTSGCRAAQEPLGSLCYVPPPNYVSSLAIWQIFPRVNESGLPVRKSALFWRFSHRVNGFCLGGAHGARHGKPRFIHSGRNPPLAGIFIVEKPENPGGSEGPKGREAREPGGSGIPRAWRAQKRALSTCELFCALRFFLVVQFRIEQKGFCDEHIQDDWRGRAGC